MDSLGAHTLTIATLTVAHPTMSGAKRTDIALYLRKNAVHQRLPTVNTLIHVLSTVVHTTTNITSFGVLLPTSAKTSVTAVTMDTMPANAAVELTTQTPLAISRMERSAANTSGVKRHTVALLMSYLVALLKA